MGYSIYLLGDNALITPSIIPLKIRFSLSKLKYMQVCALAKTFRQKPYELYTE